MILCFTHLLSKNNCAATQKILFTPTGTRHTDCEPVGRWFKAWWYHHQRNGALSGEGLSLAESGSQSDEEVECSSVEIEDDVEYLRSLDPKEWKVSRFLRNTFHPLSHTIYYNLSRVYY